MEVKFDEYLISTDKALLNKETIYSFLARSYWASKRPIETIDKTIDNSVCFGVYHGSRQIGFARVVTDEAVIFWLGDVYIDEEYRGKGIGKKLIETIVNFDKFRGLSGLLGTADAHGLYEQYGYIKELEKCMIRKPV